MLTEKYIVVLLTGVNNNYMPSLYVILFKHFKKVSSYCVNVIIIFSKSNVISSCIERIYMPRALLLDNYLCKELISSFSHVWKKGCG